MILRSTINNIRSSILHTLGLRPSALGIEPAAHPAAIIITNFVFAYAISSTRGVKNRLRFDNNVAPREDVAKYGADLVKSGKITQKKLDQIKRQEAAHANSVEHFPFLMGSVLFMMMAKLPASTINSIGLVYTLARIAYVYSYVVIETKGWSFVRTLLWWTSNICCITAVVKSANAMA